MLELAKIGKDHQDAGAFHAHLNLFGFWNDQSFITKSGDVGLVIKVAGVDYESLDYAQRDHAVKRLEAALRRFDERTRIYQILFKRNHHQIPQSSHPNPLVQSAIEQRHAFLESRAEHLYEIETYFVLVRESSRAGSTVMNAIRRIPKDVLGASRDLLAQFGSGQAKTLLAEQIDSHARDLVQRAHSFKSELGDITAMDILDNDGTFRVLYQLVNVDRALIEHAIPTDRLALDRQLCDSELEAHKGYLKLNDHYLKVLTLKEPPSETWPLILKNLLEIRGTFTVVSEWKAIDNGKARKLIQSRRRHFHNSKTSFMSNLSTNEHKGPTDELIDDSKQAAIAELGHCLQAIGHEGKYFGEFSLSIVAHADDLKELERLQPEFVRAFSAYDGALLEERYNLLNAFFATIPGNAAFNLRRQYLLNSNYADLSFLFTVHCGERTNRHLSSEYLAVLETDQATPYYLNLHHQDVAHSLIVGATGAGKSFLLNFLIQSLQKYDPQTYIFDLGGSFENVTRIFSGSYLNVGAAAQSFTINPFSLPSTKQNLDFLFSFMRVLIESGGKYQLNSTEERSLYTAVERIYRLDVKSRTITNFAAMVGPLGELLQRWTRSGQFGHVFDNVEDTLTFRPFQTFNFDTVSLTPDVLQPLLFYVLHRANAQIEAAEHSRQFKVFIIDEAWIFIRNQTIRDYVVRAEKTWRKKNAAMILATQSLHELSQSEMLEIVCESCPTKIFLANPDIDQRLYREAFHLNDTELDLLAGLVPKRDLLIKTPDSSKKIRLSVDSFAYWMATNTPRDNAERQRYFEQHGVQQGLTRLARDHPVESRVF